MSDLMNALYSVGDQTLPLLPTGYADNISKLWTAVIEPTLPEPSRVLAMFDLLKRYVEDDEAVFIIRSGNTRVNKDPKTLRRGFLTTLIGDKRQYAYTDNDLAAIMFKLIYDPNWDINYDEFKAVMLAHAFPLHFISPCKEEKDRAAFPIAAKAPSVGTSGYKVSHLFGVGTEYAFPDGQVLGVTAICEKYFPLGDYDDWTEKAPSFYTREMPGPLDADALAFLKAHFLRFACPLNYILTPKKPCQTLGRKVEKNDIGEHTPLLNYAKEQLRTYYGPAVFDEYRSLLMLPAEDYIGLNYGLPTSTTAAPPAQKVKPKKAKATGAAAVTVRRAKYEFNGNAYTQRGVILAVVKQYVTDNPSATWHDLAAAFDMRLSFNRKPIVQNHAVVTTQEINDKRFFVNDPITCSCGTVAVVNSQAQSADMPNFIRLAAAQGYTVNRI